MESAVYSIYKVSVVNSVRNSLFICREYHIQPSEILRMPYWIYEEYLANIKDIQKKEEKEQKDQDKRYNSMMPKMPSMPSMPKMSAPAMPKISIPKF